MRRAAAASLAHVEEVEFLSTHRLVPEKHSHGESVLETLNLPEHVLSDLSEIDAATNERKVAESGRCTGIGPHELVFGVPQAYIVNAAFTHPGPYGARFSTSKRGAWYAGVKLDTSMAEVAFHRRFLQNVLNRKFHGRRTFDYVDFFGRLPRQVSSSRSSRTAILFEGQSDSRMLSRLSAVSGDAAIRGVFGHRVPER